MARRTFEVKTYEVALSRQLTYSGTEFSAIIVCHGLADDHLALYFLLPDATVPDNDYDPDTGVAAAFLPGQDYSRYLDLLRNEAPVYATVDSENPLSNRIHTRQEPVGEGEWW